MKIALIQDQLLTTGGTERVFRYMVEEFSEADIFTLAYNQDTTLPHFRNYTIHTSWMNRWVRDHQRFSMAFPLVTWVMAHWDFSGYDLVLSSSATTAKYVSRLTGRHICYCYFPTRAIWTFEAYFGTNLGLKGRIFKALLPLFKRRDWESAQRIDKFIAISEFSREAIRRIYGKDSTVLFCPIEVDVFNAGRSQERGEHFLVVSRLQKWKLVDYVVEAFNRTGLPLKIIGGGPEESTLRSMAGDNIEFLGIVDDDTLIAEYGRARAVIFPPELEYGLIPIEALAAGTPVIALGRGGVLETMCAANRPRRDGDIPTAVFYDDPTAESLIGAIREFEKLEFSPDALVRHARRFDVPAFKARLRELVEAEMADLK